MAFCVLDTSIAIAWAMPDEMSPPYTLWERISIEGALVPPHWSLEVMNTLASACRRQRVQPEAAHAILEALAALNVSTDPLPRNDWRPTLSLALARGITVYDAAYLALALQRDLPLATLDTRLRDAARAENCALV